MSESINSANGKEKEKDVKLMEALVGLEQMREVCRTRELTRAQSEVVALAYCKYNLLLRGPANTGKRWIARHAGSLIGLGRKLETIVVMSKWFTVTQFGQVCIHEEALPVAMDQLRRATVLIIEDVPCHPQAAAAFFAHLDFICKVERCKARLTTKQHSSEGPAQPPFGGIQIIASQNDSPDPPTHTTIAKENERAPQVFWSEPSHQGAGPTATTTTTHGPNQLGLLVTTAAPANSNPHDAVLVINFR